MAFSTKWSKATLRAAVQRELMDTGARWWGTTECDSYITAWQDRLQDEFEFVWNTATIVGSTATYTISAIATDVLRLDAVYWNNWRLAYRTKEELDIYLRDWRDADTGNPRVVYQDDLASLSLFPDPGTNGTLLLEYPQTLTLATDTDTISIPAWTRYSAPAYCAFRAYTRFGPNQDLTKAARKKAQFEKQVDRIRRIKGNFFPDKYLSLRPGGEYEKDILQFPDSRSVMPGALTTTRFKDETPTGTVNGTNTVFTLTYTPNPAASLNVYVDGLRVIQDTHYTLSTSTITFEAANVPRSGQELWTTYRYLGT